MKKVFFISATLLLIILMSSKPTFCQENSASVKSDLLQNSKTVLKNTNKNIFNEKYENNIVQYSDTIISKSKTKYYLTTKINLYIGYNGSEAWSLYYFPYKRYKYFLNIDYQFFTSFSPKIDISTYGLLNEVGINLTQIYYKVGLIYYLNGNLYLNANLGLSYTPLLGGSVLNDMLFGVKYEIKNNIFLQMESGINNLINIGLPFNPFLKIGIGFDL